MNNSKEHTPTMYEKIPAVAALNKVPGFDPLKLLRRTISPKTKETVLQLDLPYKKLWFRLANPKGRIRLNALRITEQLFLHRGQGKRKRNLRRNHSAWTEKFKEVVLRDTYIKRMYPGAAKC